LQQVRQPGLQIVIYSPDGSQQVVCGPPSAPLLDVTPTPAPEAESVTSDAEAEQAVGGLPRAVPVRR
jgi:hypothetical protein